MIPIRDKNKPRTFPFATYILIVANVGVFLFERSIGKYAQDFVARFGLVPALIIGSIPPHGFHPLQFVTVFSSMFLHAGWLHVIGNMWFLFMFGGNVEDEYGHGRYLFFYFLAGMAAAATQVYFDQASMVPMIGASGAIAGVLGAYVVMFPRAKVLTLVPIFFFITFMEFSAWIFLGLWFAMQALSAYLSLGIGGDAGGVAFWAHAGGFILGVISVPFLRRN